MRFVPMNIDCQNCGQSFHVTRRSESTKKFCTFACYRAYEAEHGRPSDVVPIGFTCQNCGKPFQKNPGELRSYRRQWGKDPLYCSRTCGGEGRRKLEGKPCVVCGKPVPVEWKAQSGRTARTVGRRNILCSPECRSEFKLAEFRRLRPLETREVSRMPGRHGYIRLKFPRTAESEGYEILEHRHVMEQHIGRELFPEETVHHKNGDRGFNDISNLELFSSRHGPGQRVVDQIAFGVEMMQLYPDFLTEAGFKLVKLEDGSDH